MLSLALTLLFTIPVIYCQTLDTKCPQQWVQLGNTCYRIYNRPVSFSAAEAGCKDDYRGSLAIIETKEKSDFIKEQFFTSKNKLRKNTWIALVRVVESNIDSSFQWLDKSPLKFTNWQHGEPNNYLGIQYCGAIWGGNTDPGTWYDYWCDTPMFALCERDVSPGQTTENSVEIREGNTEMNSIPAVSNTHQTWLIATCAASLVLVVFVVVICAIGDFSQVKRTVSAKTNVWFRRFSNDQVRIGPDINSNNFANNNYSPTLPHSPGKVFNNLTGKE